jgi:hypothetical protein
MYVCMYVKCPDVYFPIPGGGGGQIYVFEAVKVSDSNCYDSPVAAENKLRHRLSEHVAVNFGFLYQ